MAIAGHTGYIGRIVVNHLNKIGIKHYKIPRFQDLTAKEIDLETPKGKVVLINCSGSTPRWDPGTNRDLYINNVESVEKLISAFASRIHSMLHMSTAHLNFPDIQNDYTNAKKNAEDYLNQMASKYSFKVVILRLPTIWSQEYIKDESLLHDITASRIESAKDLIRSPETVVHIAPEETIGIHIKNFLELGKEKAVFDHSNSWTGSIAQLINLLQSDFDSSLYSENELKRIYNYWMSQKVNF